MVSEKKKVAVWRPPGGGSGSLEKRYAVELESLGPIATLVEVEARDDNGFLAEARDADALLVYRRRISKEVISALEHCVVIGVGSVGVDLVDVEAATEAGIVVTNVPDVFIEEVADHAFMLLLVAARRGKEMDRMVREGEWRKGRPVLSEIPRLWGQTLGLVSFGNVARAVARRASPFGLRTVAYDPYVSELVLTAEGAEPVSLHELLQRSDYVSMHAPLNEETRHLFSTEQFQAMKPTAVLINTGRGPNVDEEALARALESGEIAYAALDVLETEPPSPESPLLAAPNLLLTPHVGSASSRMWPETRRRAGREVALALSGRWPRSCVNPQVLPRVQLERWQPYPTERGPNR